MPQDFKQLLFFCVFAGLSFVGYAQAGWSTNIWPAWESPRKQYDRYWDIYEAIKERWGTNLISPEGEGVDYWDEINEANARDFALLQYYKFATKTMLTLDGSSGFLWIETNYVANVTNDYVGLPITNDTPSDPDYFQALRDTAWPNDRQYPAASIEVVCSNACLPTNFLSYTFPRGTDGLGPHTNDMAAVGHRHGWTNAITVAGGDFFPEGRDTWYTTDYGIDGLKAILRQLQVGCHIYPGIFYSVRYFDCYHDDSPSNEGIDAVIETESDQPHELDTVWAEMVDYYNDDTSWTTNSADFPFSPPSRDYNWEWECGVFREQPGADWRNLAEIDIADWGFPEVRFQDVIDDDIDSGPFGAWPAGDVEVYGRLYISEVADYATNFTSWSSTFLTNGIGFQLIASGSETSRLDWGATAYVPTNLPPVRETKWTIEYILPQHTLRAETDFLFYKPNFVY